MDARWRGVWHFKDMSPHDVLRIQGFQLRLSLSAELENSKPVSCYCIEGPWFMRGQCMSSPECLKAFRALCPRRKASIACCGHFVGWLTQATGTSVHTSAQALEASG